MTPEELVSTPHWFPHAMDAASGRVMLLRRTEDEFRAASFLDDRSVTPQAQRRLTNWNWLTEKMPAQTRRDVQYIFHIGHVGSTLISRLLGEIDNCFALREPLPIRTFAEASALIGQPQAPWPAEWFGPRVDTLTALLSRTFRPEQRALVKASSFTSEIASHLVPEGSKALLLWAKPENYIGNLLAGEASRQELWTLAGARIARLYGKLEGFSWRLWDLTEAQLAAMSWACEMSSLVEASHDLPAGTTMFQDFDEFLLNPAGGLTEIAVFFGYQISISDAEFICKGPIMRRYAKGMEHEYSARLRWDVIAQAKANHGKAIPFALDWLNELGQAHPLIAECLTLISHNSA